MWETVFVSSSDLPAPPWSSKKGKARAKPALSRESITKAALKIVDSEGLGELSMRRLADELGTVASALYAHVSGKEELMQLLVDHVAAELEVPEPDPAHWLEQLREVLRTMHRVFSAHRDLAGANLANIPTGHNAMKVMDRILAILRAGGLSKQDAAFAADLLPMYVTASAYEGSLFAQRLEREPRYFVELDRYFRSLPKDRFPVFTTMIDEMTAEDEAHDARFEFGLDVLLRGLEARAARKKR
jgi:AcrR family transcriptional regulator